MRPHIRSVGQAGSKVAMARHFPSGVARAQWQPRLPVFSDFTTSRRSSQNPWQTQVSYLNVSVSPIRSIQNKVKHLRRTWLEHSLCDCLVTLVSEFDLCVDDKTFPTLGSSLFLVYAKFQVGYMCLKTVLQKASASLQQIPHADRKIAFFCCLRHHCSYNILPTHEAGNWIDART